MIDLKQDDILTADVEALVNTVNCVGVMGRGIALQFRKAFPENFKEYKAACDRGELRPGKLFIHEQARLTNPRYIINFPTKVHWKGKSRIEYVDAGLDALVQEVRRRGIRSIAIPPLGCGLGGLKWSDVRPRIERAFEAMTDVHVLLYEPKGAPQAPDMQKTARRPKITVGRAALLGLMNKYLNALMDPFVSLLEIHKLMYFMQEAGEGLKLRYSKAIYGPYAENLRHVLSHIEGHFIRGYGDAEDNPEKQIELISDAADQAMALLDRHPETRKRFDRVTDLVKGFETPFGLELLSTVYWVATREGCVTAEQAIEKTHSWNPRKQMFEPDHIWIAWDVLQRKGWLPMVNGDNHLSKKDH
ncbi:MAG: Appr-1-p processing protein [Deltaproteobacteria bacterium]|nr:MAG: Appr-1-p processing protein [Deltaproteobacteria bacterium]